MALTAKQEVFAQAIADGMTQADAYRTAYDAGNMKAETIHKDNANIATVTWLATTWHTARDS